MSFRDVFQVSDEYDAARRSRASCARSNGAEHPPVVTPLTRSPIGSQSGGKQ